MKKIITALLIIVNLSLFAQQKDSSYSFINTSKRGDLIVLAKVLYFPDSITTPFQGFPQKMQIEIVEVIRGKHDRKEITIEASKDHKEQFFFFKIGDSLILSILDSTSQYKIGRYLEVKNKMVSGHIVKEPSKEYWKKNEKLVAEQTNLLSKEKWNIEKVNKNKSEYVALLKTLDSTMPYVEFKRLLAARN